MDEILALSHDEQAQPLLNIIERIMGRERMYEWLAEHYPHLPTLATQLQQLRLDQQSTKKKIDMEEQHLLLQECLRLHQALQYFMIHHYQTLVLYILLYQWDEWQLCCWRVVMQQSLAESLRVLRYYLERYHQALAGAKQFVRAVIFRLLYLEAMLERQLTAQTQKLVESYVHMLMALDDMQTPHAFIANITQKLHKADNKPAALLVFHDYFLKELDALSQTLTLSMQNQLQSHAAQVIALHHWQDGREELAKHRQTLTELQTYYDEQRSQCEMDLISMTQQPEQTIDQSHLEIRQLLHKAIEANEGCLRLVEAEHPADEEALQTIMDDLDRIAEEVEEGGHSVCVDASESVCCPDPYQDAMALGNA